jgi:hypothetical protein
MRQGSRIIRAHWVSSYLKPSWTVLFFLQMDECQVNRIAIGTLVLLLVLTTTTRLLVIPTYYHNGMNCRRSIRFPPFILLRDFYRSFIISLIILDPGYVVDPSIFLFYLFQTLVCSIWHHIECELINVGWNDGVGSFIVYQSPCANCLGSMDLPDTSCDDYCSDCDISGTDCCRYSWVHRAGQTLQLLGSLGWFTGSPT